MKCLKMTHFPAFNVSQNIPSLWLAGRQRPHIPRKMTHLMATPALPDTPSPKGRSPRGILLVASSLFPRRVILNGAINLHHIRETLHSVQVITNRP